MTLKRTFDRSIPGSLQDRVVSGGYNGSFSMPVSLAGETVTLRQRERVLHHLHTGEDIGPHDLDGFVDGSEEFRVALLAAFERDRFVAWQLTQYWEDPEIRRALIAAVTSMDPEERGFSTVARAAASTRAAGVQTILLSHSAVLAEAQDTWIATREFAGNRKASVLNELLGNILLADPTSTFAAVQMGRLLAHPDRETRRAAVLGTSLLAGEPVGQQLPADLVDVLLACIDDPDLGIVGALHGCRGRLRSGQGRLLVRLERELGPDPCERAEDLERILQSLATANPAPEHRSRIAALLRRRIEVRPAFHFVTALVFGLIEVAEQEEAVEPLRRALAAEEPSVRHSAASLLPYLASSDAIELATEALHDEPDPAIRELLMRPTGVRPEPTREGSP